MFKKLSLFITLLLTVSPAFALQAQHYALIVDAGSTGSRVHVFEYSDKDKIPQIEDIFSESVKPGLSSYENNPSAAGESLKKILDDAMQILNKDQVDPSEVTISVLGTAGMRLVPDDKRDAIYKSVADYISTHYKLKPVDIKNIDGSMEGLYGWLDINYLANNFEGNQDKTEGSIDMGGASTQIVFSTQDPSPSADKIKLTLGDNTYTVYSKSFLGLGLVEALKQIKSQPLASTCFPAQYPLSASDQGNFNFASCGNLYLDLIQAQHIQEQVPDLSNMHFVAYSGAYYTHKFFGIEQTPGKDKMVSRVKEVCNQSWDQLKQAYPKENEAYLSMFCANGVYLSQLLYESYQIPDTHLSVSNKVNDKDIDWTLGALLYQIK